MTSLEKIVEDKLAEFDKEFEYADFPVNLAGHRSDIRIKSFLTSALETAYREGQTDTSKVNRVEVINHTKEVEDGGGRAYVYWDTTDQSKVELSLQDKGRTLKVFISNTQ